MSTLHTVNKSPFERSTMASCLAHLKAGDAVLIIEDGVVGARKGTAFAATVTAAIGNAEVFVLGPDLAARGMGEGDLVDGVKVVDYDGFVDLVTKHDRTQAWL